MAVQDYIGLDLGPNSAAAQDLRERVAHEAEHRAINLTGDGDGGAASANLTPEMSAWLGEHVLLERQAAINDLKSGAAAIRLGGNLEGIVGRIEDDRLRRTRNTNRTKERENFYQAHGRELDALERIEHEHAAMRAEEGNRDAKVPTRWVELLIPLLIMFPESFINYDSFLRLWKIQAVALGLTVIVGIGIGLASYMVGKFIKGWAHYMGAYNDAQNAKGLRLLGVGIALLAIALSAVGYARYRTVLDMIDVAIVTGQTPPNLYVQVLGLLLGNILIFVIGVGATYLIHDENPDYAEKTVRMQKQKRIVDALVAKRLQKKLVQIDRAYDESVNAMERRARLMEAQADYRPIAEGMGKVEAKDKQAIALLQSYRTRLISEITKQRPDFTFGGGIDPRLSGHLSTRVTLAEFGSAPLSLYRC